MFALAIDIYAEINNLMKHNFIQNFCLKHITAWQLLLDRSLKQTTLKIRKSFASIPKATFTVVWIFATYCTVKDRYIISYKGKLKVHILKSRKRVGNRIYAEHELYNWTYDYEMLVKLLTCAKKNRIVFVWENVNHFKFLILFFSIFRRTDFL